MPNTVKTKDNFRLYEDMSDEQIIDIIRNGNEDAERYLCQKYMYNARRVTSSFFIVGGEKSDLQQEAMIGLVKAIRQFNKDSGAKFSSYAELCMRRQVIDAIRKANNSKNIALNDSVSIYEYVDDDKCLLDRWLDANCTNPEYVIMMREKLRLFDEMKDTCLSDLERQVFDLYLKGNICREIALTMDKDEKSIDNALQRAKKKVSKLIVSTEFD